MEKSSAPIVWNVATDGSKMSLDALNLVTNNLMKSNDKLIVTHIYDKGKSYLSQTMRWDHLKGNIEAELMGKFTMDHFKLEFVEKDPKISIA